NGLYTMTVSNVGQGPTAGVVSVTITLPPGLRLISASGQGWTCSETTCERSDVLPVSGSYPPIQVRVGVDTNAPASLTTAAEVRGGGDLSPGNNRAVDATNIGEFVPVDFKITKTVNTPLLRPGDSAIFTVQALNNNSVILEDVTLTDSLPRGFSYVDNTSFITIRSRTPAGQVAQATQSIARASRQSASAAAATAAAAGAALGDATALVLPRDVEVPIIPEVTGNLLKYSVGTLSPGETASIRYATIVGVDAKPGPQDTQVIGSSQSPLGPRLAAVPVLVQVIVLPSSFSIGQIAVGRVFEDLDDDGEVDRGEPGLKGVRVLLPSGESAITDKNGLYNLPAMANRSTAIAIDPSTLPPGYRARRTGPSDGLVRLQRTPLNTGALLRQNFPVVREAGAPPVAPAAPPAAAPVSAPVPPAETPRPDATAPAPIATVRIQTASAALAAGGLARTVITVSAADATGQPAAGLVRLETSAGQLLSAAPSDVWQGRPGVARPAAQRDPCATTETGAETPEAFLATTLEMVDGQAAVCLISGLNPGVAILRATAVGAVGAVPLLGAEASERVRFDAVDRPAMIVAIGELSFGYEVGANETVSEAGVQTHGQFFYQDSVLGGSQLTVAMNSVGPVNGGLGGRLFQLDPTARTYPVFGDSSTRQELAQSNSKVYARFDRGRSHVMFGDLRGDTARQGRAGLADVSRTVTGLRAHYEPTDAQSYTAVVSRPDTVFRRDVFTLQQNGAMRLTRAPIVLGSETLTLEVRDRRSPEEVVRREVLVRSVDYLLDPLTGVIYFRRPLDLFDDALNLTNLVAAYEHLVVGLESTAYVGRARGQVGGFDLSGSVFSQEVGGSAYVIGGAEIARALPNGGRFLAEMAQNHGASGAAADWRAAAGPMRTDSAWRIGVEQPFENGRTKVSGQFQRVGEFFQNPFGSPTLGGTQFVAAGFETTNAKGGTLRAAMKNETNASALVDNSRTTLGGKWSQRVGERVILGAGLDHRSLNDERARREIRSNLVTLQGEWKPTARVSAMARREQNLGDADPTYPDQTVLTGSYLLSAASKLFVTQRLSDRPIVPISGVAGAELLSPLSTRETAIGIQSSVSSHTDVTSRMQLDRGLNGTDAFALVGTRTRIPVRKGFGVDWGFDHAQRVQGTGRNYTSGSVGMAYMPDDRLRGSISYELRSRETVGHAFAAGFAGRLGPGMTALVNYRFADVGSGSVLDRDTQAMAALAWRPETSDRYGLLFSWNSGERSPGLLREPTAAKVGRLSTDGYFAPGKGLELHSRLALINSSGGAITETTTAYLYQGRLQQRVHR
ncbi:MAG: hypothetical protein RJA55_2655, partial [Acidobacteriota bacterium]